MRKEDYSKINKIIFEKGYKKRFKTVIAALSCFVFFCTAYLLILPAVTMENESGVPFEDVTLNTPSNSEAESETVAEYDYTASYSSLENSQDSLDSYTFEHNKTIDYLADKETNPDTDLSDPDCYRLYLDMTGKQEPVDLLIVVDGSGSMSKNDVDNMRRDYAITKFLNGSTVASNDSGFISYFLSLNSDNKVSVIQFYGKSADRNTRNVSTSPIDYRYDSAVLLDWTQRNRFVSCANQNNSGTNYEAGLKRAAEQFSLTKGDGRKKIMIFLSDGVPTYFQIDANDIGTVCNGYTLRASDVGKRWGTGSYTSTANYPYCKNPSKKAFDDFMASVSDVTVFTIGVSADVSETSRNESQSPEVLKYMADNGNGAFLSVIDSMDELKLQLQSVFYPKGVTVTDNLSKYVRFHSDRPDVLVTMTEKATGNTTVLYKDGAVTKQANGILTDVVYTEGDTKSMPTQSTGTVSALFDENYQFKPDYTYTLSFNVQTTHTAYREFASDGYSVSGDAKTDYGTNSTSSEKEGFYSNDSATVSYKVSDTAVKEIYRKPVIQIEAPKSVTKCTLIINKTVLGAKTTSFFPFELTVTDSDGGEIDFKDVILPSGITLKDKEGIANVLCFSLADGDQITVKNIIPKGAHLVLTETEHSGYTVTMSSDDLGVFSGETQSFDLSGDLTVTVNNTAGVRMPETGGVGTLPFTLGGLLLTVSAFVYRYILIRSRERRSVLR